MASERTFSPNGNEPFIFDNNWGNWGNLPLEARTLTTTNADAEPVIPLTEEQKFTFDTKGWLMIPGLIPEDELSEMRKFCYRLKDDPESLPKHMRTPIAGPLEKLVDHPVVVGFCNEFLAYPALATEEYYGFRFETSFLLYRNKGMGKFGPHNGNGLYRLPGNSHEYRALPGKGYSGLTRVVWELNPVKKGDGGTLFVSGSHKAAYSLPQSILDQKSPLWETYECPAGSVIFFSEATTHSAQPWTNDKVDRVPIFNQYNGIGSRFHWWEPPKELLETMPPKRQSLFRHAYGEGANTGLETRNLFERAIG
ncbi:phytanoyl-CoA dioxygenase family protein [Chloroflexi bacterium TSY]|nr:phytanoyl-CoA dioxygenase family protein [Chloroflexi bacterium TSY]